MMMLRLTMNREDFMRKTALLLTMLAMAAAGTAVADDGDAVVGIWLTAPDTEDGQAKVEIYKEGDTYHGKIIWLEIPVFPPDDDRGMAGQEKVDRDNPEESLRSRPIVGLKIMSDFTFAGKGKWKKGTIYAPDDGKTYKCKLTLEGPDSLKVRGFVGISMLGRTEMWTRATDEE